MERAHRWLAAGAALTAFAVVAGVVSGAVKAADLGGNCCADLEERIAELEATTARKGNRKVSLTISGFVGHQVMWWDDGTKKDMYIGDGGNLSSRFRLIGEAKINPQLTAGFLYEFGAKNNSLGSMTQGGGGSDDLGGAIELRDQTVWLRHAQFGMVKIGHGSTATDNLILIDVANISAASTPDIALFNGGFFPASKVGGYGTSQPLTWGHAINGGISFDTARRNHVLWASPSLAGFTLEASVAENSFWDVALRYAGEFAGFRVAGGVGYSVDKEAPSLIAGATGGMVPPGLSAALNATQVKNQMGSLSVMHVGTGLFVNAAAGRRQIDGTSLTITAPPFPGSLTLPLVSRDPMFWHVAAGLSRNYFGIGATSIYGEYQQAKDFLSHQFAPALTGFDDSMVKMWGFGVVQGIDAAGMEVFAAYKNYGLDLTQVSGGARETMSADKFQAVIVGTRIQF